MRENLEIFYVDEAMVNDENMSPFASEEEAAKDAEAYDA